MCSRATYAFEVENPVQKAAEVPQRYSFDYQIQTPVVQSEASTLQGLLSQVDKVVVQKQGMMNAVSLLLDNVKRIFSFSF